MPRIGLKSFLIAAVCYLTLAAISAVISHYSSASAASAFARTHFHLLGFVAMLIYGLGYSIAPKLGRRPLRFPRWVPIHFWLGNVSLVAMVISRAYGAPIGISQSVIIFYLSVAVQVLLILAFVVNLWLTLMSSKRS
ncbi:MAG: hypothetical protein KOO62_11245 [candidate division Zixibacteria bacterium]|nr:hypothetical protein [candidate division Zixibacteria bacterium]